jgi:hypothetical protein
MFIGCILIWWYPPTGGGVAFLCSLSICDLIPGLEGTAHGSLHSRV